MPIEISLPFDRNKIERTIHYWLHLLANEDYAEAFALTEHNAYFGWTPELIKSYINGYGLPYEQGDTVYKVTDWKTAYTGNIKHYKDIELFNNPINHDNSKFKIIGIVHYDLPLNGEWSDLTTIFKILQADNYITLELNDIHVL